MTESRRPFDAVQPEPIDDTEDRMGSLHELDFDEEEQSPRISDLTPEHEREQPVRGKRLHKADMTEEPEPDDDELSPENLIREDGARDAHEAGEEDPADWDLSIVDEDEIGGGSGLDEAELAQSDPLDGKP